MVILFLPETLPKIVGDGSIQLGRFHQPWLRFSKKQQLEQAKLPISSSEQPVSLLTMVIESFSLLAEKDVFVTLIFGGITYTVWSMITSSTPSLFQKEYDLNDILIGLAFLPNGK